MTTNHGTIYLVGTGPGDSGLITVKGLSLIREADAIVGDALNHAQLLQEARPEAEIHDVGCRGGNKVPPEKIYRLLLDLAQQGKMVVRLWRGDPFVFCRAAQEIAEARRAGIRVELVPGVTSAIAAPAYAGVPLSHWEYTTNFAVVSGYESKNPDVQTNWTALAGIESLVILMPLDNLSQIVARLLAAGRAADTPALAVQQGTLPQQKQVLATLDTIVEAVKTHQIEHPAIVVVGKVAELSTELAWFQPGDSYPLLGKRVLVTRPAHQATDFMAALRALGAEPISFPTIQIQPVEETGLLDTAIQRISRSARQGTNAVPAQSTSKDEGGYDWLVFTSANGVTTFWDQLLQAGLDSRSLAALKIAAIGPATAASLQRRSITPDLVPAVYTAEGVLAAFDEIGPVAGQRFLLARADIARKALAKGLVERGAVVDELAVYRTVPLPDGPTPPVADIITFTSSSTVRGYVNCLGERPPAEAVKNSQVVCIGPITAATAEELGMPVKAVAKEYTIEGVLNILKEIH